MKINPIYILCFVFFSFISCRKEDSNSFDGPSLNDLNGPFNIISSLNLDEEVDFESGEEINFDVELSKNTLWEIEITGQTSGAIRTFSGTERIINSTNTAWLGGSNTFPSFQQEKAIVKMSFPNEENSPIIIDSVNIIGLKQDKGYVITDFENGTDENWSFFNQSGVNASINCNSDLSAKGSCFYKWEGTVSWDWAIGSFQINANEDGFGLPANAGNLFFNMATKFISNTGPDNCFILLWFDEDDNGDGSFNLETEDRYIYEYWYENDKWNLASIKYDDLKYDGDGQPVETNGNGLLEPSKLIGINVFFLANKDSGIKSEALVDHIIFTENEAYKP